MPELRSHLGRHQPKRIDLEAEERAGWRRHGILVIAEHDPRLSWPEQELVRQPAQACTGWLNRPRWRGTD